MGNPNETSFGTVIHLLKISTAISFKRTLGEKENGNQIVELFSTALEKAT